MKKNVKDFLSTYITILGGIWIPLEIIAYFRGDQLRVIIGSHWITLIVLPIIPTLIFQYRMIAPEVKSLAGRFYRSQLAGVVNADDLLQLVNKEGIPLIDGEADLIRQKFDQIYTLACETNILSKQRIQGEFKLGSTQFYYNRGHWESKTNPNDPNSYELVYYGHGIAWTKEKYNFAKQAVQLSCTVAHGEPVDDRRDLPKEFSVITGISLNCLNWAEPLADAVTFATGTDFTAIRSNVYRNSICFFGEKHPFEFSKSYDVIFEYCRSYFKLDFRKAQTQEPFSNVVYKTINDEDIRNFQIPTYGHIALFAFGHNKEKVVHTKTVISQLRVRTREISNLP